MAPEYVMHGNLSVKADVYSFGVVALELISGQKNFNFNLDPECQNLLEWVRTTIDLWVPTFSIKKNRKELRISCFTGI